MKGEFHSEIVDYFDYAQLKAQGENTAAPRKTTGKMLKAPKSGKLSESGCSGRVPVSSARGVPSVRHGRAAMAPPSARVKVSPRIDMRC